MEVPDQTRMEATAVSALHPVERGLLTQLQARSVQSWHLNRHPGWAIWDADSDVILASRYHMDHAGHALHGRLLHAASHCTLTDGGLPSWKCHRGMLLRNAIPSVLSP